MRAGTRTRCLFAAVLIVGAAAARTGHAASLVSRLMGEEPPQDSAAAPIRFDHLDPAPWADLGYVVPADLLDRSPGFDSGRIGVEGVFRSLDPASVGRGRLTLDLDGLPAGSRVVHWDNLEWIPIRALRGVGIERPPAPGVSDRGGAGALDLETFRPGDRPTSTVSLTGGSYGHRLAELDFERRFGRLDFHADVANLSHDGFGAFANVENTRGFVRLDFPLFGHQFTAEGVLQSGGLIYVESGAAGGMEATDERRFSIRAQRPGGSLAWSYLEHSSRLETPETTDPFELSSGMRRAGIDWRPARGPGSVGLALARETRTGVLAENADFLSAEARLESAERRAGKFRMGARLDIGYREPTGFFVDPMAHLRRGIGATGSLALSAGRVSGIPALLFHEGSNRPDRETLSRILSGLETLETPESHWSAGIHAAAGATVRAGLYLGVTRTSNRLLLLRPVTTVDPFRDDEDPTWTGQADAFFAWQPSAGFGLEAWGGWHEFDPEDEPFRARLRGEGRVTLRRLYFERDLDLSVTGFARIAGSRVNLLGEEYPTLLTGGFNLTGRIRTLTLFWRFENVGRVIVESDLVDGDIPVYLPGLHNRIGATLHLVD